MSAIKNIFRLDSGAFLYLSQVIYVITAASIFFFTYRRSNRYAWSHWLTTYDAGFIKRGLVGALVQVGKLAVYFGVPVVSVIDIFATAILVSLYVTVISICWRIATLSSAGRVLCPFFLTLPLLWVSAFYNGYYDQIVYLFMTGIVFFLLKKKYFVIGLLAAIAILVHESSVFFYFPLLLYWISLQVFLGEKGALLGLCRNPAWWWAVVLPLVVFSILVAYQSWWLSVEGATTYIENIVSRYPELFRGSDAYIRTFLTPFPEWFDSESPAFFSRLFSLYGFLAAGLPLFLLMTTIYLGLANMKNALIFCGCSFFLILVPTLLFMVAWDTDRIWTYPVFLALLFIWMLLEMEIEIVFLKATGFVISIVGFLLVVFMIVAMLQINKIIMIRGLLVFSPILILSGANIFLDKSRGLSAANPAE